MPTTNDNRRRRWKGWGDSGNIVDMFYKNYHGHPSYYIIPGSKVK